MSKLLPSIRHLALVAVVIISLLFILFTAHPESAHTKFHYQQNNSSEHLLYDQHYSPPVRNLSSSSSSSSSSSPSATPRLANATFVILSRNSETDNAVRSVREIEEKFNRRFGYPYVFLNEEPFTDTFKERVSVLTDSKVEFGVIPREHWYQPDWIDEDRASKERKKMQDDKIIYGGSLSYRNMCRFNSGFFFKHPLLQKYRYYWRIEPGVHFHCDVHNDPFVFMQQQQKVYGFTITMYEFAKTIKTLWKTVREFTQKHPEYVANGNAMDFMSSNGGESYNLCHFWSNFEIADMDFWRGEAYTKFFEYLDATGGFYYERWGDAPVHSIAVSLFLPKEKVHFFEDIGYEHPPYTHCPLKVEQWKKAKCSCDRSKSFDYDGYSCLSKWDNINAR